MTEMGHLRPSAAWSATGRRAPKPVIPGLVTGAEVRPYSRR